VLGAQVVISDKANADKLRQEWNGQILVVEDIFRHAEDYERAEVVLAAASGIDTDPVYSIFTSGSTGTPKGVVVSHRGVLDYIDWAVETFKIDSTAVIGNQAPFYFDNSTLDIYLMYATGATLDIIPEMNFSFPAKLVDYLNDHKINFVFWVPFVLINVANFDIFKSKKPLYLRDVFFAGEVMPNKHLNYWRKHLPQCRYANLYGPTEITVDCTYYVVDREFRDDEPLPIGIPCKNSDVLILVDQQRLAKVNEEGELCVRGTSLALGYYNDWEKTQKAFIQNPLNKHYPETIYCTGDIVYTNERGEIMYVGRKDAQIKHNGYRIELGEIENAVLATNLVDNCCAVYDFTNKKIVLFYQAAEELNMAAFRKAVSNTIPRYMLPTDYYREDMLKQNGSGKIDRAYYKKQING
jgi:amino acid adenylation domain-containing protein